MKYSKGINAHEVARYEAQAKIRAKIKKEFRKQRWSKVLTFFCKAMLVAVGILYGIIIMEQILVGKPLTTYLGRVVGIK